MRPEDELPPFQFPVLPKSSREYSSVIDSDYRLRWVSWDGGSGNLVGKFCYDVCWQRQTPCAKCPVREALASGRPCVMDKSIRLRDGSFCQGDVTAYPVRGPQNRPAYVFKLARDTTDGRLTRLREQKPAGCPDGDFRDRQLRMSPVEGAGETGQGPEGRLTVRERQVLNLLAEGRTNPEIAGMLAISRHTVKSHVISIFNKLGVTSRAQATLRAARLDLL